MINGAYTRNEMVLGLICLIAGVTFAGTFKEKKSGRMGFICMVCILFAAGLGAEFLNDYEMSGMDFAVAGAGAALNAVASWIFVPVVYRRKDKFREITCDKLLSPEHPVQKMMQSQSEKDYLHAQRVSMLCGKCAQFANIKVDVCMMGGMYYRIGRIYGRPYVANGVKIAMDHGFPPEVVDILSEYEGEYRLPSSVESAVVNIVDWVVTKLEAMEDKTFTSEWNKEMLIYNTLNEKSRSGIYDESGLSMNLFLKIREYLVKEELQ